jgi:hypothetical protein
MLNTERKCGTNRGRSTGESDQSVQVNNVTNAVILILVIFQVWSLLVEVGAFRYNVFVSVPAN